jgi:hypothetical protein
VGMVEGDGWLAWSFHGINNYILLPSIYYYGMLTLNIINKSDNSTCTSFS